MATAARLDIASRRNEARVFTMRIIGLDLTGVDMRQQVRGERDAPGVPIIDLGTVTSPTAQGIRLVSVTTEGGLPVSTVAWRYNLTTMRDQLPYAGELGEDAKFVHAVQFDGVTRFFGDWWAVSTAMDSDASPLNRPGAAGFGRRAPAVLSGAAATFSDDVIEVTLGDAALLVPLIAQAEAARDAVKPLSGSGAPAAGLGIDGSVYYDVADPLNPIMYGPKVGSAWGPARPLRGPSSPADNVAGSLLDLKSAPLVRGTMLFDRAPFKWTLGNFTGQVDDKAVVQSDHAGAGTGAWVRQSLANLDPSFDPIETPGTFTVTVGGAGNLIGRYAWAIAFGTDDGEISHPTGRVEIDGFAGNRAELSNIPVSTDQRVTRRYIYRTFGNPADVLDLRQAHIIYDNVSTTYTDDLADSSGLGVPLQWLEMSGVRMRRGSEDYFHVSPNSVGIGKGAMPNGGYASVAIGSYTLGVGTKLKRCVALGDYALGKFDGDTGESNAIGVHSFNENENGYGNNGLGYCSGFWNKGSLNSIGGHFAAPGAPNGGAGVAADLLAVWGAHALGKNISPVGTSAAIGAYAGGENEAGHHLALLGPHCLRWSQLSYLVGADNRDRGSEVGEFENALLIGQTAEAAANQFLKINGVLKSANSNWYDGAALPNGARVGGAMGPDGVLYFSNGSDTGTVNAWVGYHGGDLRGVIQMAVGGTTFASLSDARKKANIADAGASGDTIDAITVRSFDWKGGGDHVPFGFVAQELNEAFPDAVVVGDDETPWMVDPAKLVPLLVQEIQDLRRRIAVIEAE